ncbi:MAG: type II toxin-antitoxin system YoeB family toxin [Candidatus Diapherotrites archaeon]|nr:type II toxin-antitoxin system YoeB family toxin [Candidatus Diapherotrites archaeon]
MKKPDKREKFVLFIDENTREAFEKLQSGKYEDIQLYGFIDRAIDDLKANPFVGINLPKRLWPKEYVQKYRINNLWKYDLPNGWRLLYTVKGTEVEIIAVILEWMEHKEYDRKFHYKGK